MKVNMSFSDQAIENTKYLTEVLNFRTRTAAVESSLMLTALIVRRLKSGGKLQIVGADGSVETIIVPGMG